MKWMFIALAALVGAIATPLVTYSVNSLQSSKLEVSAPEALEISEISYPPTVDYEAIAREYFLRRVNLDADHISVSLMDEVGNIQYRLHDLQGDGQPEIFATHYLPRGCGSAGCPEVILENRYGSWEHLHSSLGGVGEVASTTTNGYADLISISGSIRLTWSFNGNHYEILRIEDGSYQISPYRDLRPGYSTITVNTRTPIYSEPNRNSALDYTLEPGQRFYAVLGSVGGWYLVKSSHADPGSYIPASALSFEDGN